MANKNSTSERDTTNSSKRTNGTNGTNTANNSDTKSTAKNTERRDGSGQGFASMEENRQREIASQGGRSQGKENNPGNFANDPERAKEAGKKGGSSGSSS